MKIFVPFSMFLPVLIELFRENNSFTHTSQAQFTFNEVKPEFDNDQNDILKVTFYSNQYDIFYYRIKEENGTKENKNNTDINNNVADSTVKPYKERLIANIQIVHNIYYKKYTKYDVLELYTIYVSPDYRKQGLAKSLIMESTRKVCQHYNLTRPIFALHLNPKDQMMNISFSFYVNLGFVNVAYVNDGPYDMQFDVEKISTKWDEIQDRPASGRYLAMFCFDELGTGVKGDFREVGENIRGKLLQFGEENKKTTEKAAT